MNRTERDRGVDADVDAGTETGAGAAEGVGGSVASGARAESAIVATPAARLAARIVPTAGWSAALVVLAAGAMAFLAVVGLAAGIAAGRLGAEWQADLSGSATVRMEATDPTSIERVLAVLRETPGIAAATPLEIEAQRALLAPWLGDGALLDELPVPRLIDVTLSGDGPDTELLAAALNATAPGTVYDDHGRWRAPMIAAAIGVERLAVGVVLLVAVTAAGVTALAARASLAGNAETVRVIRLIGGSDGFITRTFVRPLAARTTVGAFGGGALAALTLMLLPAGSASTGLPEGLMPDAALAATIALGVAVVAGVIGWVAARIAVRSTLADLP
ncbi:MAG: cell division protein FtsX [Pseudomonadota bacterium]